MQDYIEVHLKEVITLHALADCTSYSPWHASRIFKEVVGMAPFEYIRKLRLSKAAVDLWDERQRILDVAIDYVFDSHDGFTRAFTKEFHMTPSKYKKETPPLALFHPDSVRDHYRYLQGDDPLAVYDDFNKTYFVQVMHFPQRKLIYKPSMSKANNYFDYVKDVGCDVWGILCSIKEALYEPVGVWFPEHLRPQGCSEYVQGVEVDMNYNKELKEGFASMILPSCEMMVFQGAPFKDEYYEEAIRYLNEEIDHYQPTLYGYEWDETSAFALQLEPLGYRGYIEARGVRKIKK